MASRRFVYPDERAKPRHKRRFVYNALTTFEQVEVRAELETIISSVDDMLWKLVREIFPKRTCHDVLDEMVQAARVRLFEYSLPHYDLSRRVKVTTFVFHCAQNHLRQLRAKWLNRRADLSLDVGTIDAIAADSLDDRQVERAARAILADPDKFGFTRSEARALLARASTSADVLNQDLGKALGYTHACGLSRRLAAVRVKLQNLDIFSIQPDEKKSESGSGE